MVEAKVKKTNINNLEYLSEGIYIILRKTPGYDLDKILAMYITQFQWLVSKIVNEYEEKAKAYKKNSRR